MAKQQWIFKAYSGIHLGAEVSLGSGEYSVGSGYGCDVIIDDSSLSSKHFLLRVSEDGFEWKPYKEPNAEPPDGADPEAGSATDESGKGASGTESEPDTWQRIDPYEVVSVGAFRFAYGILGGSWPPLRSDDRQLSEQEPDVSVDVPQEEEDPLQDQLRSFDGEVLADSGYGHDDFNRNFQGVRRAWFPWAAAAFIGLGVMIWIVGDEPEEEPGILTPTEQVLMIVQERRLSGIRVSARPDPSGGREAVRVSGFVETLEQKAQLTEALRLNNLKIEEDIVAIEFLKGAVELLAERYEFPDLTIKKGAEPGTLVATGYVSDVEKWQTFRERVERDVPSLTQLIDNVETQDMRFRQLKRMIRQHGLEGQIDVWQGKGEFVVSPSINPDMRREWERLMQSYYRQFGDQPPIRQEVVIVEGFDVRSVSLGDPPFVVMSDGQKFTEGARLRNGYMIHRIDKKEVVLRRDGKYVVYPIDSGVRVGVPASDNERQDMLPETNESKKDVTESYFIS